jgi:hypothetical protein
MYNYKYTFSLSNTPNDHDLREVERLENCREQDFVSLTKPTVLYIFTVGTVHL